jgi:hypothetical protein
MQSEALDGAASSYASTPYLPVQRRPKTPTPQCLPFEGVNWLWGPFPLRDQTEGWVWMKAAFRSDVVRLEDCGERHVWISGQAETRGLATA